MHFLAAAATYRIGAEQHVRMKYAFPAKQHIAAAPLTFTPATTVWLPNTPTPTPDILCRLYLHNRIEGTCKPAVALLVGTAAKTAPLLLEAHKAGGKDSL
jgi:hypothetical protein